MTYYYRNDGSAYTSSAYRTTSDAGGATQAAPQVAAVRVESVAFPGVYLCTNGSATQFNAVGTGWAGCEYGAQSVLLSVQSASTDVVAFAYNAALPVVATDLSPNITDTGVFLRMDGVGVTAFSGAGAGTVNCQYGVGPWEEFRLERQSTDGIFAIASMTFPGVYLRMDGQGVKQEVGARGGTVNCQYGVGPWEQFLIHRPATF
jgi:hypothetical protein